MPRIRTVKPESLQHRKVGRLTDREFRLWIGMLTQADDDGRLVADPGQLRLLTFGYFPRVTVGDVEASIRSLAQVGLIRPYTVAGVQYADFPSWRDHQRINRPTPSRLPSYEEATNGHGGLTESSLSPHGGSEGIGEEMEGRGGAAVAAPPGRSASPSLAWNAYLANLSETDRQVLASVAEAIATTRKAGKLAPSVLDGLALKLGRYPSAVVTRAAQVYLDRGYAADGKAEAYLLGIVRGEAKQNNPDVHTAGTFQNGTRPKTPGQLAIERALQAQAMEQASS
jgi:hypothetical protein